MKFRNDKYVLNAAGDPVPEPDVHKWGRWFVRSEWIIDPAMPEWRKWYKQKLRPEQAVTQLFKIVRQSQ